MNTTLPYFNVYWSWNLEVKSKKWLYKVGILRFVSFNVLNLTLSQNKLETGPNTSTTYLIYVNTELFIEGYSSCIKHSH